MKKRSPRRLAQALWHEFSIFIRRRDNYVCFTCGRKGEGSGIHAGHFVPSSVGGLALRYHEENVRAQCYNCNINLGGNQYEYAKRLGLAKAEELLKLKNRITKDFPYEEKIAHYKKLNEEAQVPVHAGRIDL